MINDVISLLPGLQLSILLLVVSLVTGLPLGLLAGWLLHEGGRKTRLIVLILTEIGRGFPALITLYLVYFGLPSVGVLLDAFPAMVVTFAYTTASYTAEIFRSALAAIPPAQLEAATALSLGRWHTLRFVVLPQAMRIVLPPLVGFSIIVFHATALAYSIGLRELLSYTYNEGILSFEIMRFLLTAAALYLAGSLGLRGAASAISRRSSRVVQAMSRPSLQAPLLDLPKI